MQSTEGITADVDADAYISTGSEALDKLLGGGVKKGCITSLFGEFSSGKTQLCHTLAVNCQLLGDANSGCVYIDTKGTFCTERLIDISKRYGLNRDDVLSNIFSGRAIGIEEQTKLLIHARALMSEKKCGLLIVDSATLFYGFDCSVGRAGWTARQKHLGRFMRILQSFTQDFGCAVVIVDDQFSNLGDTRLAFSRGLGKTRICELYHSPCLAHGEAKFTITEHGIVDMPE